MVGREAYYFVTVYDIDMLNVNVINVLYGFF